MLIQPRANRARELGERGLGSIGRSILQKLGQKNIVTNTSSVCRYFLGWVEAFPTKQETATVVAKKILEKNFPKFRMPKVTGLDKHSDFVSKVSQRLAEILGTNWKLHCAYHA